MGLVDSALQGATESRGHTGLDLDLWRLFITQAHHLSHLLHHLRAGLADIGQAVGLAG